ncbi:MAG: hypothetical protein JO128_24545 [Alphaproteobacteria bacterium]|nr:hypothetical protein [Alphaproteobacteria bacterium]
MLRYSAEARWFFDGNVPEEAVRWFHRSQPPKPPAERSDTYVRQRGCASVGIKFREQKFEVKSLCAGPEPIEIAAGAAGFTDRWVKWSVTSAALPELERDIRAGAEILEVGKRRWMRGVSAAHARSAGCDAELCEITLGKATAWTFAFEAYGRPDAVADHLAAAMQEFLSGAPAPFALSVAHSLSYPAWLDRQSA